MTRSFLTFSFLFLLAFTTVVEARQQKKQNKPPEPQSEFVELSGVAGNYLAGRQAGGKRDLESSAEFLQKALEADPTNIELLSRTFIVLVASGKVEEGVALSARVANADQTDRLAKLVMGVKAIKDKRYNQVPRLLNVEGAQPIADITGGLLAAWAAQGAGKSKQAFSYLDRLRGAQWYAVFRDYHGALIAELSRNEKEAEKRYAAVYKVDNAASRIVEAYVRFLARQKKDKEALDAVNAFLSRSPDNPVMRDLKVDIEQKKPVEPLFTDPRMGAAEVMFGLGSALARDGGDELAAIYLQLALYLDPTNGLALISLADLYNQMKQQEAVIKALERVPDASPMKRMAEVQLAISLDGLERTEEAQKHLDTLLARDPKDLEALTTKANLLRSRKKFAESLPFYDRAIALINPEEKRYWPLYYARGISFERTKQWPKAEADFKKALELQPDHPQVLNYLGYSWIDQGINLDQGMRMLKRAVEQRPNDAYIIDSVGWAYYRMGQYEEALKWLERAVEKNPADPVLNDHLGDVYWQVDRKLEAFFQWRHAKDLKPEPEDLVRIERKLKEGLTAATANTQSHTEATSGTDLPKATDSAPKTP